MALVAPPHRPSLTSQREARQAGMLRGKAPVEGGQGRTEGKGQGQEAWGAWAAGEVLKGMVSGLATGPDCLSSWAGAGGWACASWTWCLGTEAECDHGDPSYP